MHRNHGRSIRLLAWSGLVVLALRPIAPLETILDRLFQPLSLACELASPLDLLRRGRVQAAERRMESGLHQDVAETLHLLEALARNARPSEPALRANRRLIHGEVLGPSAESRDRLRVRLADLRGVEVGLPVASGNCYVGRVAEISSGAPRPSDALVPGVVTVELVTASAFHVGARVHRGDNDEVLMTVGGLDEPEQHANHRPRSSGLRLAVHHPSDRSLDEGLARVFELFADAERFAALADGFHLGRVRRAEEGRVYLEPEIDYEDGLYHVVVLATPGDSLPLEARRDPSLFDSSWLAVAPLSVSDPNPARESAKLRAGARDGVRPGAAVAMGPRLVGRVTRVGPTTSDLSFVGDPGFSVVAVALFEGEDEPRVLGRLVTLGRESGTDRVRMRWNARIALGLAPTSPDGTRGARLFTGSGDSGLESGFFLGEARLPVAGADPEPSLTLSTGFLPADSGNLHVRLDPSDALGGTAP